MIDSGISDKATAGMDGEEEQRWVGEQIGRYTTRHTATQKLKGKMKSTKHFFFSVITTIGHGTFQQCFSVCSHFFFFSTAETLLRCCYHSLHLHVHSTGSPLLRACQKHISGESTISPTEVDSRQWRKRESTTNKALTTFCSNTHLVQNNYFQIEVDRKCVLSNSFDSLHLHGRFSSFYKLD